MGGLSRLTPAAEARQLRAALAEARAETGALTLRLRAAERQVAVGRALALARRAASDEDDRALGAALEELSAFAAELEDANAALAREVAERRAELVSIDVALRESEERVRLAHRHAGAGSWDWNIAEGTMSWSGEYRDLLGLAVYREFGPPDDPGLVFFLGQGLLEVSGHAAGAPGSSVMIWIQVRDVHAEHARLAAAGVPVVREPAAEPWGLTEMHVEDPDGIRVIATSRRQLRGSTTPVGGSPRLAWKPRTPLRVVGS